MAVRLERGGAPTMGPVRMERYETPVAAFLLGAGVGVVIACLALLTVMPTARFTPPPLFSQGLVPTMPASPSPSATMPPLHRDAYTVTDTATRPATASSTPRAAVRTPKPARTATRAPTARPEPSTRPRPTASTRPRPSATVLPVHTPAPATACRLTVLGLCLL